MRVGASIFSKIHLSLFFSCPKKVASLGEGVSLEAKLLSR